MTRGNRRENAGRHPRLPSRAEFVGRVAFHATLAGVMVLLSLALGVVGYHVTAGLPWIDALLNASMILTGMGPVDPLPSTTAKLFASAYAIFSGVAFLSIVAVLLAPLVHRFLHRFHLELADDDRE
jgi:hypothetical protein